MTTSTTDNIPTFSHARTTVAFAVCAALVAFALCILNPVRAQAEVLKADIVLGETVEQRGLSVSQCPNIDAEHAIVMDELGTVFFERDADTSANIASITKVMTAVCAVDNAPLETSVTVGEDAANIGESTAQLIVGDTLTLKEALKAMLVPSGNDAAQAVAESVGARLLFEEGSSSDDEEACVQRFVDAMNQKAKELGMDNSYFTNPHGLDDGQFESDQHSCARDIAKLAKYAMSKSEIREVTKQDTTTCRVRRDGEDVDIELASTDLLLSEYDGALGIKTGFTDSAGPCFCGAVEGNGMELYSVVLNSSDEYQRFQDTSEMWDWVFNHTIDYKMCNTDRTTSNNIGATVPLAADVPNQTRVNATLPATFEDPSATVRVFDLSGNVSQQVEYREITGSVSAGDVVGTISFLQHNKVIGSTNIVAAIDVPGPNIFEGIGIWWTKLIGGFAGDDCIAEGKLYNQVDLLNDKSLQNAA